MAEGLPIQGFCWYSLTDQVDRDTCIREANGRVNDLGLVDLDRHDRVVAPLYRHLAERAGQGDFSAIATRLAADAA